MPLSRKRGILELLDRIEAYVLRYQQLPAALYLELRQAIDEQLHEIEQLDALVDLDKLMERSDG